MSAFKIDFHDPDAVIRWHRTADGLTSTRDATYRQTFYVDGTPEARDAVKTWAHERSDVTAVRTAKKYTRLQADERSMLLAIECPHTVDPHSLASHIRRTVELEHWQPGTLRFYNVDLAPQFRYCLETGTDPTPAASLRTLQVTLDEPAIADRDLSTATVDDEPVAGGERAVIETIVQQVAHHDPDVLIINDAELIPLIHERALAHDIDLNLGRDPGWTKLSGENIVESYGLVHYSSARYDVPGRVIINTGNSFLWVESSLAGLLYLVEQSQKPLQETAWGSIGNILTSMQIREATSRDVVIPWNKWEPETFKTVETLHAVDRGGFIMDPTVGFHENVVELDFSSLYPYIMCEYNISPDSILCTCHPDRTPLPGIDYNVCPDRGFIADVLEPLLADRDAAKATIRNADDNADLRDERAMSGAIKWILVSCFGYQGYRNSKFGRIECHEAINAVARDIFLEAKSTLEAGGWQVIHGIVDSIWVTPSGTDPTAIDELASAISETVGIELEHEATYDWVMFVPRRGTDRGALTRYIAKKDGGGFKLRGIEARQRSTPPFIDEVQRELLSVFDETRDVRSVLAHLERELQALRTNTVEATTLATTIRVSKPLDEYTQQTVTVGALQRAKDCGMPVLPGQSVRFVVTDNDAADPADRVRLVVETPTSYDESYYEEQLLRATESILSPLGWDRSRIDRYRSDTTALSLDRFINK